MDSTIKHITIFSGAGISAESGLKTFRGQDGLWEGFRIEEVATPEAWEKDPELVQRFYNERRKACLQAKPNPAHFSLVELEKKYKVDIITQNIDDLHERAGSQNVLHLHGEIVKSQSSKNPKLTYPIHGDQIEMGEFCELGSPLRPHVVWFGEAVPNMVKAYEIVEETDLLIVVGTSLKVYPAANLLSVVRGGCPIYFIDPQAPENINKMNIHHIQDVASISLVNLVKKLTK